MENGLSRKKQIYKVSNQIFEYLYIRPVSVFIYLNALILIIVTLSTLAFIVHPVEIDFSLSSLIVPTHHASLQLQSYLAAKHVMANGMEPGTFVRTPSNVTNIHMNKRSAFRNNQFLAPSGLTFQTPYSQTALYPFWTLDVVFIATGNNSNILTEDRIQYVRYIEQEIMQHKDFDRFCLMTRSQTYIDGWQCTPPNSITTYFYPSIIDGERIFDGNGPRSKDPIEDVVRYAFSVSSKSYWFVDEGFTPYNMKSRHLRTQFLFGFPIKGYRDWSYTRDEQRNLYKEFIKSYIPILDSKSTDTVKVFYGSTDLYDYQAFSLFCEDLNLAILALVIVYLYMAIHTFSFVLAAFAGFCILGSIGVSYFIMRVIIGQIKMNILNGISLFVILGIGVDDVFVFIDTYKQLRHVKRPDERLKKTFMIAGRATLFTSATTAVAYSANIISKIPAVSNFGCCMFLLVITCYVIVTLVMPAVLSLWHSLGLERKEMEYGVWISGMLQQIFPCCKSRDRLPEYVDISTPDPPTYENVDTDLEEHVYNRLGDTEAEEPVYEVMSGENLYDRITREKKIDPVEEKKEDEDSGVDPEEGSNEVNFELPQGGASFPAPEEATEEVTLASNLTSNEPYCSRPQFILDNLSVMSNSDGLISTAWLQHVMRFYLAPFIDKMKYVTIVIFIVILGLSMWGGTQIQTPNHPPEIFPRDSNIQHFINLSYDFTSNERCDKCSGYFADRTALEERAKKMPKQKGTGTKGKSGNGSSGKGGPDDMGGTSSGQDMRTGDGQQNANRNNIRPTTKPPVIKPNKDNEYIIPPESIGGDTGMVDLCGDNLCTLTHRREDSASTAEVMIVFGIKGVDMSHLKDHVTNPNEGIPLFDERFKITRSIVDMLCRVCKNTLLRVDLVKDISGLQNCSDLCDLQQFLRVNKVRSWVPKYLGYHNENKTTIIDWIAMPFRSTTPNGISNCMAYHDWKKWQDHIAQQKQLEGYPDELDSIFQTSDRWSHVFTEVVLVDGAIRGIAISLWFCIMATIVFTGHPIQTVIVMFTIVCEIGFVFGCFFMVGLKLGAVEAISLAILVGTSVDYCVHLVEGYRIAGMSNVPATWTGTIRGWRLRHALNHIGVPIVSSAITTILAALILSFTQIQMFSRFGKILALTMTVSLFYSLFMAGSLLATVSPVKFTGSYKSSLKGLAVALVLTGMSVPLPLYLFKEAIIC